MDEEHKVAIASSLLTHCCGLTPEELEVFSNLLIVAGLDADVFRTYTLAQSKVEHYFAAPIPIQGSLNMMKHLNKKSNER